MAYVALSPAELRERGVPFPAKLGLTGLVAPGAGRLVQAGGPGAVTLVFDCDDYGPDLHGSVGVAAGEYDLRDMAMLRGGTWTGAAILLNGTPHELEHALADGAYRVRLHIDEATARAVQHCEEEHLADFAYAWSLSYGAVRSAAAAGQPAVSADAAVEGLVERLSSAGHRYLVPRDPHDVASWGQHIRSVYTALGEQSDKRDIRNEHSAARYALRADSTVTPKVLRIRPVYAAAGRRDSANYLDPTELPVAYAGPRRPVAATGTPLAVGTAVTWRTRPRRPDDADLYPRPDSAAGGATDVKAVLAAVDHGLPIAQLDGEYVWLKADLTDATLRSTLTEASRRGWPEVFIHAKQASLTTKQ